VYYFSETVYNNTVEMLDRPQALAGCKPSRSFGASLIGVLSFEVAERNDVHRTRFVLCRSVE